MHTGNMLHASEKQALVDDTHDQRTRFVFAHVAYILHTDLSTRRTVKSLVALLHITYKAKGQNWTRPT